MKKRYYAVIFSLILTLCCCLTGFAAAEDGPPVTMEVSSIYGEVGKMGVHIPLTVKLYGQSTAGFDGTLAVQTLENAAETGAEVYEYLYPVSVGTGETIELELYVPLGQRSSEIHVVLTDQSGTTIGAETMSFDISRDMGRLLIGALTERAEELQYLEGASLDYGMVQSKLLPLDEEHFPGDIRGLEMLDLLVINRFETDRLSSTQTEALMDWVEDGGTLLIGTGALAYSTLGPLAEELVELPIGSVSYENINLGSEYEEKAPGDSDVTMACAELEIPGGLVVEESDGIPLLTMVERGEGEIGIYCYDLSELTEFTEKNSSYVSKMLSDVLDADEISNLYYYSSYGSDEDYWNAYSLVNTGNADRLPNLGIYALVIVVYIVFAGPGLYMILKKKDMSRFYSSSVVMTSIGMAAVIYLMGVGTRFTSQFFTVASIMEMDGAVVKETSYMNVRTPDSRPFSVTVPAEYSVTALTRTSRYDEHPVVDFERNEKSLVELLFGENGTILAARQTKAFEPRFFKLEKESTESSKPGISGNIRWMDGTVSGVLSNNLPFTLEDAALMLYGQMYPIGDWKNGEVLELTEEPTLVWPVSMSYMAAGKILGNQSDEDASNREYLQSAEREGLFSYYIGDRFATSSDEAYLVGIGPGSGMTVADALSGQETDSLVLYTTKLNVAAGADGLVYRSGLTNRPEINSGTGAIYGDGLTMYGMEPLVVEYLLGDDLQVEKLSFLPISDVFLEDPGYYYMKRFDGVAYFYNNMTRVFDRINLAQVDFGAEELRPYLSAKGTLIVKYTILEGDSAGVSSLLPHLMVTGRAN